VVAVSLGTSDPSAPYGGEPGSFAFVPDGLAGLFFDQRFGLFSYAPVLIFAIVGIAVMLRQRGWTRHASEFLFVVVPYLVLVTYVAMWWGGASAPARFVMPVLPWMAIPAAAAWTALTRRSSRAIALAALAFTMFASASLVLVGDGRLAFNVRETYAYWLEWLNGNIDLARGLPVWWRDRETPLFRGMAIWAAAALIGWFLVRRVDRVVWFKPRARFVTGVVAVCVAAGSSALSATWVAEGVSGRAQVPSQLRLLRHLSAEPRLIALDLTHGRRIRRSVVARMVRIEPGPSTLPGGAGRNDRPLFAVPAVPAGEYRIRFSLTSSDGWIMVGIGRDQFALQTQPLSTLRDPLQIYFPVDVRAIVVRGDEDARRSVAGMTIEPVRVLPPWERLTTHYARRAVHYQGTIVYFLDDRSFPEPEGFWIGGARESAIVLQPDGQRPDATVHLRNGPVANDVVVGRGSGAQFLGMDPGEETQIVVPIDAPRGATLLPFTTRAGFRPSEVDPKSRDDRFLGVWVKIGSQNLTTPPK
jgi:hypothetical protein